MKSEFKITYSIVGKTKAGIMCSQGFSSCLEKAIAHWIAKFPRFNGNAVVKKQLAENFDNGISVADPSKWEKVFSFTNNKELKTLIPT